MKFFILSLLGISTWSFAQNEVEVKGSLPNHKKVYGIGHSSRFQAGDASGLLFNDLAKINPTFQSKSLGQGSASGFGSFSIRHQDAKNTEVWLDGVLIDDPLTNFPIALNIDLASLGYIQIHEGPGPLSIASSSAAGSVEIHSSKAIEPSFMGLSKGDVYGDSYFARFGVTSSNLTTSLFLRTHKSTGSYPFYYDNLTPYNRSDDRILKRNSNESASEYGLWKLGYQSDWHRLNFLALKEQNRSSLPIPDNQESLARSKNHLDLASLNYQFGPLDSYLSLGVLTSHNGRSVKDPLRLILARNENEVLDSRGLKKNMGYFYDDSTVKFNLRVFQNDALIEQKVGADLLKLERMNTNLASGAEFSFLDRFILRSKGRNTWIKDQKEKGSLETKALDASLCLLAQTNVASFWVTTAYENKPPSLLEVFGNQSSVMGNPDLLPQKSRLWELGVNLVRENWRGSISLHRVMTRDKIVFVRANSNALKGQNAERTKLDGVSVSAEQEMFPFTFKQHVYLSNTVDPKFKSGLPFEPWALANAAAEFQASSNLATGAEVHFKSEYIRDVSGDSISPQTYQVDSFLRYEWRPWDFALNVNNLFNERSQRFKNQQSGETGETAVADFEGHPLPGRQIRISAMYKF